MIDDPRKATAMAGGLVGAFIVILTHLLAFYGIDLTTEFAAAIGAVLVAVAGYFVHPVRDDLAALHRRILARLDDRPAALPAAARTGSAADMLRK